MKRIEKNGKFYRMRRGKLVEIPPEWVDETTHPQTIRKRDSKQVRKTSQRRVMGGPNEGHPSTWAPRHSGGRRNEP